MFRKILALVLVIGLLVVPTAYAQSDRTVITPENGDQLTELIRLGRGSAKRVLFTPDGETLLVGGSVGIWLYDFETLDTETEPPRLVTDGVVRDLVLDSTGTRVFAMLSSGDVEIWDLETQERVEVIDLSVFSGATTLSPDDELLAVNTGSRGIMVYADSTETFLTGSFWSNSELAFSPDGSLLAAVGSDSKVYFWDVVNSEEGANLQGHSNAPETMSFSPDGQMLATGGADIRIWNVADATEVRVIASINGNRMPTVKRVRYSPDGTLLASGHSDGQVVLWDAATGDLKTTFTGTTSLNDLTFSPDGSHIVSIDGNELNVRAWDVETGELIAVALGHTQKFTSLDFSPDSSTLAFAGMGDLYLWDTNSMQELHFGTVLEDYLTSSAENLINLTYSPNGELLGLGDSFGAWLLDAETHEALHELRIEGIFEALVFSPDSSLIVVTSSQGMAVFDVASGEQLAMFKDHKEWLTGLAFSPDQTLIATAALDNTVRVYGIP